MTEASDIPANPDYRRIEDDYKEKRTGKGCIAGAACRWNLQYVDPSYVIEVEDHGPGIDPEDMEQIFEPGFSTKINYETGEVNRGLGLSLVKDFIELRLGGTIRVTSVPGKTVFTLTIPKEKWSGL